MPKSKVNCSKCGCEIERWIINPATKKPIKNFFCDTKCKGVWQTEQRESLGFTKEWLINEYVNKGKSANQIAKEIGRDSKRVWEWIRDYGIKTRSRGHNTDHLPKDGSAFKGKKHKESSKQKIRQARLDDGRLPCYINGIHWLHYYKDRKHPKWKGGLTPERQRVYYSEEWISAVKEVWKRDNATCKRCNKHHNKSINRGSFHIHHIVSFMIKELRTEVNNLVLLCKECHKFVHSKDNINKEFIKES